MACCHVKRSPALLALCQDQTMLTSTFFSQRSDGRPVCPMDEWQTGCICCMGPPGEEENYLHSKTSGAISLSTVDESNLGGNGKGRMSSRSGNHLWVNSFCDAPRPAWWTSHRTREVADVSVIITWPPGTLAAIAVQKKEKQCCFLSKQTSSGFYSLFLLTF